MNTSIHWIQHLSGSQIDSLNISWLQAVCGFICLIYFYQFMHHKKASYLLGILLTLNITFAERVLHSLDQPDTQLYLWRRGLYLKSSNQLTELHSTNNLFNVEGIRIAILSDHKWYNKQATTPIPIDYLYVCRGFNGTLYNLMRIFQFSHLILDHSLSDDYREKLKKACEEKNITCIDLFGKTSYCIEKRFSENPSLNTK